MEDRERCVAVSDRILVGVAIKLALTLGSWSADAYNNEREAARYRQLCDALNTMHSALTGKPAPEFPSPKTV
jgi:hypothetical protein